MVPPVTAFSSSSRLDSSSLRLDLFSEILACIFRGELKPGTRLKTLHLAKHYGVSSTPVREAIMELTGLGVVENYPNRGAVVAPFGLREVREMYHVRRLLEVEAARYACRAPDLSEIEEIYAETKRLLDSPRGEDWISRCVNIDRHAHRAILDAANFTRIRVELNRYERLLHVIRSLLKDCDHYQEDILQEHLVFLGAILRRDEDAAAEGMTQHMEATCQRAINGLSESYHSISDSP